MSYIISDARLAGRIDWNYLIDRTRRLTDLQHFDNAQDALFKLASWYHIDFWENQQYRPEVWIEKDALVGVIERVCQDNDVPFCSCRGYTSQSEMWRASQRLRRYDRDGQTPVIFHFGDHDPSGIDMSRDIDERLQTFMGGVEFHRIALNMDQVDLYSPPPNPIKMTDSRSSNAGGTGYVDKFGDECWELDALNPPVIVQLIQDEIDKIKDLDQWKKDEERKEVVRKKLEDLAKKSKKWKVQ